MQPNEPLSLGYLPIHPLTFICELFLTYHPLYAVLPRGDPDTCIALELALHRVNLQPNSAYIVLQQVKIDLPASILGLVFARATPIGQNHFETMDPGKIL